MNPDAASLENLRDIVAPPPVPWWPPALGWWVLLGVLAVTAMILLWRASCQWKAKAYRRAALRELSAAADAAEIAEILKRAALCAQPREEIAGLSGAAWCQWLGETGTAHVPDDVAQALTEGVFGNVPSVDLEQVTAFARDWIRHHRNQIDTRQRA